MPTLLIVAAQGRGLAVDERSAHFFNFQIVEFFQMTTFDQAKSFFDGHALATYRRIGARIPALTDPGGGEGVAIRLARALGLVNEFDNLEVKNKQGLPTSVTEALDDCGFSFGEGRQLAELLAGD